MNVKYFSDGQVCTIGELITPIIWASIIDDFYTGFPYHISSPDGKTSSRSAQLWELSRVVNDLDVSSAYKECHVLITDDKPSSYRTLSQCMRKYVDVRVFVSGYFNGSYYVGFSYLYKEGMIKTWVPELEISYGRSYEEWVYIKKQEGKIDSIYLPLMLPKLFY